jgi:hypothetical protein
MGKAYPGFSPNRGGAGRVRIEDAGIAGTLLLSADSDQRVGNTKGRYRHQVGKGRQRVDPAGAWCVLDGILKRPYPVKASLRPSL